MVKSIVISNGVHERISKAAFESKITIREFVEVAMTFHLDKKLTIKRTILVSK